MSFATKGVSAPSFTLVRLVQAVSMALLLSAGAAHAAQAPALFSSATASAGNAAGKRLIQVVPDQVALQSAKRGQILHLELPGLGNHEVVFDGSLPQGDGLKWMGHLKEGVQYSVILVLTPHGTTGTLRTPEGLYELGNANGQHWIVNKGTAGAGAALASRPAMFRVASESGSQATAARKPAKVAWAVNFDLPRMSSLQQGADVSLKLPGLGSYDVVYDNTMATDRGSSTWVGHLKDYGTDFRVIITSGPEGSLGNILTPSGELELTMVGNQQWIVDRQASGQKSLVPDHSDSVHPSVDDLMKSATAKGLTLQAAGASATSGTGTTTTTSTTTTTTPATVIDVLILYTPGFVTKRGTQWRLRLDQLVALANQAYIDSGVNIRLRLVATQQVAAADNTYNSTVLPLLLNNDAASGFAGVAGLRTLYGADLVTLVRPFSSVAQGGNCGVGYVLGSAAYPISMYSAYAYSVVSDGTDTAAGYYCTDYTFAHEMGHNMGSMHDRATVAAQGGGVGAYPYGFGYGMSGTFGTVMSYINPRIGKFSNPGDLTCGGKYACGVSEVNNTTTSANNVLSLNNTRAAVASFQSSKVPDTLVLTGVIAKAGIAVAGVAFTAAGSSPSGTAATCTASTSNGSYSCSVPLDWSGVITPVLTGATFTPASLNYTGLLSSQTNQNFTKN